MQVKPEAKSYYELGAATLKFTFPEPAPLDGVTSRQKSILSMKKVRPRPQAPSRSGHFATHRTLLGACRSRAVCLARASPLPQVSFAYPGVDKKALVDITCHVRLESRVAVLGRNGAGKSTLIKILTAELKANVRRACNGSGSVAHQPCCFPACCRRLSPSGVCACPLLRCVAQDGTVTRHPNLRVAYVAQHAFFHLEENLDISPARYILRRYSGGEDKEEAEKVHRKMTADEWEKVKKQIWTIDGQPRVLDKLVGRRKKKRSYEYEVRRLPRGLGNGEAPPQTPTRESSLRVEPVCGAVVRWPIAGGVGGPLVAELQPLDHARGAGREGL